jgi:hypothetical protein
MANNITKDFNNELAKQFNTKQCENCPTPITNTTGLQDYSNLTKTNEEKNLDEKWSEKYKKSIDCKHPKGFSQKAHCQGKKKKENKEATGSGGAGGYSTSLFGSIEEKKKVETKEATGAGSSGSFETTAAWSKSMNKKDWRGAAKTQIPGGKFVQVKKKCKKFPYCNQGDIKALKIFENETLQKVIKNLSIKHNLSEDIIKSVILTEIKNKL